MKKTDTELREDVLAEIEWEPSVEEGQFGVAARDGVVTLSGQVDNYYKKTRVMQAVKRVEGVAAIADEITISSALSGKRTDTDVAQAVHSALAANMAVPTGKVQAVVDEGRVTLEGVVDWQYQRQAAEHTVERLRGVRTVNNLIRLAEHAATPSEVKAKIEAAFKRRADIDASHITVRVDGAKVVLEGTVPASFERDAAESAAWGARGIRSVEDRIKVNPLSR
jgi:osmotically-inducible protein OsmY